jgi:hypothetical protein
MSAGRRIIAGPRTCSPGSPKRIASLRRPVLVLHREAIAGTVDPETVFAGNFNAPAQEGGLCRIPAKPTLSAEPSHRLGVGHWCAGFWV